MTWREISADDFNSLKRSTVIDVRSPCEFLAEHIPGAVNVPLFTNEERDFIGTIYATSGEMVARRKAMDIISPKIPTLIDKIIAARGTSNAPIVIHCWRGGLRSEAVASCLSIVGIHSWRLTGGYKAWRAVVLRDFAADRYSFKLVALQGHTGTGKTDILQKLAESGAKVLDLEKLANHRGSVFGALGLGRQPSQKDFDSLLWLGLRKLEEDKYDGIVFCEAEGKTIGRLRLPAFLYKRLQRAPQILVTGTMAARCERVVSAYSAGGEGKPSTDKLWGEDKIGNSSELKQGAAGGSDFLEQATAALATIKERIPGPVCRQIIESAQNNDLKQAVELLLINYYDHYYQRHIDEVAFVLTLSGDNPDLAAMQILDWSNSAQVIKMST